MEILDSILLGILQGLTEFLPVSSSGHLELLSNILGVNSEENLSFSIVVHAGTVLSTIVVFWSEIVRLIRGFFKFEMNPETQFLLKIFVSFIPIIIVGLTMKDYIESLFGKDLSIVGISLIITSALLWFSSRPHAAANRELTYKNAFIIGIAQAFAVLPGLSRSGSTISTGLLLGVDRGQIAKFSFLMVLIPIIGINFLEIIGGDMAQSTLPASVLISGFLASFISGTFACKWMIKIVSSGKLWWFALYCLIVGASTLLYTFFA